MDNRRRDPASPLEVPRVLVIDDDARSAELVAKLVRRLGYRPTVAMEWTIALKCFRQDDFDIVLMDAVMPNVDGFRLTQMLRHMARSYVPIVFITGLHDDRSKELGIEMGADDFLSKPVDPLELRVRMAAMLRIRALTRRLEMQTRTLERMALVDTLTGVSNRRSLDERLPGLVDAAADVGGSLSVLMLDIDHFKRINDTFGHATGDRVLEVLGALLTEHTRRDDVAARYGGEEFALVCPNTSVSEALCLGDRIRERLGDATEDICGRQTLSFGVSATDLFDQAVGPPELLASADAALYRAKRTGRNRGCMWDPAADTKKAA